MLGQREEIRRAKERRVRREVYRKRGVKRPRVINGGYQEKDMV